MTARTPATSPARRYGWRDLVLALVLVALGRLAQLAHSHGPPAPARPLSVGAALFGVDD